jgi:hypothetical protein
MANDVMMKFGSPTTVISESSNIDTLEFSTNTTQLDNSTALYPYGKAVLTTGTWSPAPADLSVIDLYMVQDDVDGTTDETSAPLAEDPEAADWVGSFVMFEETPAQTKSINISLHGVQKARFFIKNQTAQTLVATTTVKITPFTYTPST